MFHPVVESMEVYTCMRAILILLAAFGSCFAYGLDAGRFDLFGDDTPLLRPDFSSSMSFSFTSGGGRSWGAGTYVGSMGLLLHPDVTAAIDLGYTRLLDFGGPDAGFYLGGVGLDWKPSESFLLQIHMSGVFEGDALEGN